MSAATWSAARAELLRWLEARRNPDGGWGYGAGRPSRLEPTAWALLTRSERALPTDVDVLRRWKTRDELLVEGPSGAVNLGFVGVAAFAWLLQSRGPLDVELQRLLRALTGQRGIRLPPSTDVRQDNSLQGWPWVAGTFSWVEPTAWSLLALKRWRAIEAVPETVSARIREGEALLADRARAIGGWNYGNPLVMGKVLLAFVPTTALALLALGPRGPAAQTGAGVAWLHAHRFTETSPSAMAWAAIALRAFGVDVGDLRDRLLPHVAPGIVDTQIVVAAQVAEALAEHPGGGPFAL